MSKMKVAYNDDAGLLFTLQPGTAIETIHKFLDWTTERIPIDYWALLSACPDVCYYRTQAGEIIGQRIEPEQRNDDTRGLDLLLQEGTDLLEVYIDHLHRKGIKVLPEIRMSDTHHRDHLWEIEGCPIFSIEHPQYAIKRPDGIKGVALDYSYPEVREHRLAIMRELAEERNIDGLELNFIRWAKHFERDLGREKAPIMTEFVAEIRSVLTDAAEKRGVEPLILGARVPSTINEGLLVGCDVVAWIRHGYLDYVIPSEPNCTWPGLNVEQFAEPARGTNCEVYAQMGDMIGGGWTGKPEPEDRPVGKSPVWRGYHSMLNTPEEARAAAYNYYTSGAQGIGFWNIPNNFNPIGYGRANDHNQYERMRSWIQEVIDLDRVKAGTRRYHYLPIYKDDWTNQRANYKYRESGRSTHGEFKGKTLYFNEGMHGTRQTYPFRMADGRNGSALRGTLRFRMIHCVGDDRFDTDINGTAVAPDKIRRSVNTSDPDMNWTWLEINLGDCPQFRFDNELGITWQSEADHGLKVPYMEELDIFVEP